MQLHALLSGRRTVDSRSDEARIKLGKLAHRRKGASPQIAEGPGPLCVVEQSLLFEQCLLYFLVVRPTAPIVYSQAGGCFASCAVEWETTLLG
ncbi:MAG: hypothetical protein WBG92_24695 [Thiohalocapsa sp.]